MGRRTDLAVNPVQGLIHQAVLRTRGVPGLSGFYRGAYRAAQDESARVLGALPGVGGVLLHRGMAGDCWTPGISDIDLILEKRAGQPDEAVFLHGLSGAYRGLKSSFPMLGDLWVGHRREIDNYRRWGGLRAWEDAPHWVSLRGGGDPERGEPPAGQSDKKKRWLDPWVWAFTSHMEISRRLFSGGSAVSEKDLADAHKLYADFRRFSAFLEGDGRRLAGRSEMRSQLAGEGGRSLRALWQDSVLRLGRISRRVLGEVSAGSEFRPALPPSPGPDEHGRLNAFLSSLEGAVGMVIDSPYHTYCLFGDDPAADLLSAAAERVVAARLPGVPLILDRASWTLCLQSSYLGAPLGWTGSGKSVPGPGSGIGFCRGWGAVAAGDTGSSLPLLTPLLAWETAAEAASWLALWWRYLWIDAASGNRFVLFHLYSRILGLRLALDGRPPVPFSCLAELLSAAVSAYPDEAGVLESLEKFAREEPLECIEDVPRGSLAPEHVGLISAQIASLQNAIERGPAA